MLDTYVNTSLMNAPDHLHKVSNILQPFDNQHCYESIFMHMQADTCGDADGAGGNSAPYACTGIYKARSGVGTTPIQGLTADQKRDACCVRVRVGASVASCWLERTLPCTLQTLTWAALRFAVCLPELQPRCNSMLQLVLAKALQFIQCC
jgi:hypothetical protein